MKMPERARGGFNSRLRRSAAIGCAATALLVTTGACSGGPSETTVSSQTIEDAAGTTARSIQGLIDQGLGSHGGIVIDSGPVRTGQGKNQTTVYESHLHLQNVPVEPGPASQDYLYGPLGEVDLSYTSQNPADPNSVLLVGVEEYAQRRRVTSAIYSTVVAHGIIAKENAGGVWTIEAERDGQDDPSTLNTSATLAELSSLLDYAKAVHDDEMGAGQTVNGFSVPSPLTPPSPTASLEKSSSARPHPR